MQITIIVKKGVVESVYADNPGHIRAEVIDLDSFDDPDEYDAARAKVDQLEQQAKERQGVYTVL